MSAASIPNLNSLRRDGPRGRGRGRGGGASASLPMRPGGARSSVHHDEIVQNTDNDAATSRMSAVQAGYLDDPLSAGLMPEGPSTRRLPLMNRGTYVRTTGIDRIVDTFLDSSSVSSSGTNERKRKQIISLGAGSDTRYFRLKQKRRNDLNIRYHELDFATNTRRKIAHLRGPMFVSAARAVAATDMLAPEVEVSEDGAKLVSPDYVIHPQDLRELQQGGETSLTGVDVTLPTLIISECCLIYLPPDDADAVLQYFSTLFPPSTPLAIVIYEPIRPHDSFGKRMVSNLLTRGIQLHTLEKYSGLEEQRARLAAGGFGKAPNASSDGGGKGGSAEAADIDFIWRRWISAEEKERVEALEWMDEVEEFVLLAQHYCICWGWRAFEDEAGWRELPAPV